MALKLPHTGQAVLLDLGDSENIHFGHKREAGERLAAVALAHAYGKNIPFSGPVYSSMKIEDGKIRLQFDHVDGGLVARPLGATYSVNAVNNAVAPLVRNSPKSELEGFAICGEDRKWGLGRCEDRRSFGVGLVGPGAQAGGGSLCLGRQSQLQSLQRGGLPASTFRTDDFPAASKDQKLQFP